MLRAILSATLALSAATAEAAALRAAILRVEIDRPAPISRLDLPPEDIAFAGARLATEDNATTGRFLGHSYETLEVSALPEDALAALEELLEDGVRFVAVAADADTLIALADRAAEAGGVILNVSAPDDRLRGRDCRANLLNITPSRAMLADGLAQYLVWKRWDEWLLVSGDHPADELKAEAYRRAARKFGADIEDELVFEDTGGARRSDSGHVLVQKQIPVFMQDADDHDVVVVADESELFGVYLPYRTWEPRPVAGDAGLRASAWHPAHESFGATQLQRRFEAMTGRRMTDLDYEVWAAFRTLGEAVTRTGSANPETVMDHLLSDDFELAAFKGLPLSFRPWSRQLRQGIILGDGRNLISISPQEEFLHERTRLDTLGVDEGESACDL
jgi:ABC transporter substrate binding protein (PQQ-dependent alcohol dehydrogenase system)